MEYELVLATDATQDIDEAIEWYEAQKEGLGIKFALSFKESVRFLENNPQMYAKIFEEIRRVLVRGFPYSVYYLIEESKQEVLIFAVIHNSRNPKTWQGRVRIDK
jgi:plasmid stabilization system protein ParE